MERLTKREGKHTVRIGNEWRRNDLSWNKLAAYEDAEEQGLLLRLPVPEGTDVYELIKIVDYGEVGDKGEFKYYHRKTKFCRNMIEKFGETVFLTEGQAAQKIYDIEEKQALAKMKEV